MLWRDALLVTDPAAVAAACGRGEGSLDKAAEMYAPVNGMTSPHGTPNLLTAPSDAQWRAIRKARLRARPLAFRPPLP